MLQSFYVFAVCKYGSDLCHRFFPEIVRTIALCDIKGILTFGWSEIIHNLFPMLIRPLQRYCMRKTFDDHFICHH